MNKLSIVTINWNNADGLRRTLESVAAQHQKCFEYLVIDGNSTDGSRELIREFSGIIDYAISEPDKGIYDAMLKGTNLAKGHWVWFLNSGDTLVAPDSAIEMSNHLIIGVDVLYGDYLVKYSDDFTAARSARPISKETAWRGMPTSHQACIVSREAILKLGFDQAHGFAADYGQLYRLIVSGGMANKVAICPVIIDAGGISDRRRIRSTLLHSRIVLEEHRNIRVILYWCWKFVDQCIRMMVKKVLSENMTDGYRRVIGRS